MNTTEKNQRNPNTRAIFKFPLILSMGIQVIKKYLDRSTENNVGQSLTLFLKTSKNMSNLKSQCTLPKIYYKLKFYRILI